MIRRVIATILLYLAVCTAGFGLYVSLYAVTHAYRYHGQNAGVVADLPMGHACAGIEWRGTPGVYAYADCRNLS